MFRLFAVPTFNIVNIMLSNSRLQSFIYGKFLLLLSAALLFLLGSCNTYSDCPDDYQIYLQFYKKETGSNSLSSAYVSGNYIDNKIYTAFGVSGGKVLPLSNLAVLPIDISEKQMLFVYKNANRSDTLILRYDLARKPCDGYDDKYSGMYLEIINPVLLKNTFNESNPSISCHLSGQSIY